MCRQTRRSRSWICSNRTSRDAGRRARMEIDPDAPGLIKERLTPAGSCSRPGRTHAIPARTGHFPHEAQRITRSSRARRQVHPSVVRLRVLVRTACSPRMHHQPGLSVKNRIVIWLATGLLRVLAFLPYTAVARFGEGLGALLYRIPSARRRVVHTNLKLCFPDMGEAERERLARAHFRHVIRSYVERGPQWFGNARSLARLGVPACTLTSVSRLAKAGNARVVPFVTEVLPDYRGYRLKIFDAMSDFPSDDASVDARRLTAFLESEVRRIPDQYYWVHKRFKNRPMGEPAVY